MKKTTYLLIACFALILNHTQAQVNKCCSGTTVAPELTPGFYGTQIHGDSMTPLPVLAVTASLDLPNTDYLVTKRNTPGMRDSSGVIVPDTTGGGGDVIIGADVNGVFTPNSMVRYGIVLHAGDTFDLTAIGYDLAIIQNLADSLLNAITPLSGPCCGLFAVMALALNEPTLAGFCDSVNNAGIYGAGDIYGMSELLTIFDVFAPGQLTVPSVISTLQIINSNGTFISSECGGIGANNFMPYGINKQKTYGYDKAGTVAVQKLSDVSLFMMYPNPSVAGDVYVYFTTSKEIDLNINVYDAIGQKVHHQTLGNVSGSFNTQIPTGNLAAGMYFVELTDGHSNQTHKLQVK